MNWMTIFSAIGVTVVGNGIFATVLGVWVTHRLAKARDAETRASALRDRSRAVADILAEWVRSTFVGDFSNEDRWRMQTTYWKNILDLDKELIVLLFPLLANAPGHITTNEMIVRVRKFLLDLKEPDLKGTDLNNWPPRPELESDPLKREPEAHCPALR